MTKQWEAHEKIIRALYAQHTLTVVRKTMMEKYNFKASTRAYRGRLLKWGMRKYNCRRKVGLVSASFSSECSSSGSVSSSFSSESSSSGSDTPSPPMSQHAYFPTAGGSVRDNEPRVSNLLGHSYGTIDMGRNPLYNMENSYDRNRSVASLTQKAQFDWNASPIQSAPSPPGFGHASAAMFGYPPPSPPPPPPATTVYPSAVYESAHPERDTRRSLPGLSARQYHHEGLTYPSMRDYRYQPTVGMGSFSSI